MRTALQIAQSVKGQTYPNPPVGAVVVKDHVIRGLGAHLQAGTDHAEVHAINMAGDYVKGSTLYVTLEPCSHTGKIGPCVDLIVEKEISRVVIAVKDPNERVSGKGIDILKEANIAVDLGVLGNEAKQLNDVFFHYINRSRPYITLKSAVSLDGKIATKTGESKWITCEESRRDVHFYRHLHDAILVGVNTVIEDDPLLTTRLEHGGRHPKRIILDSHLRTPLTANVITNNDAETIIFVGHHVTSEKIKSYEENTHVHIVKQATKDICIDKVVTQLGEREIASVLVEGGATVHDSFLQSNLVNHYILYLAPKLMGGKEAPTAITGEGISSINDVLDLDITHVEQLDKDVKIIAVRKGES